MHRLSVWCSLKAVELCSGTAHPPQWSVCKLGEDTSKEQVATARTLCATYCQPPSSSGVTWEHTETEPKIALARGMACTWAPWAPQPLLSDVCPSFSSLETTMCTPGWQANSSQLCSCNPLIYLEQTGRKTLETLPGLEGICFSPGRGAFLPRILFCTETFHR